MARKHRRQPREIWKLTRQRIYDRDRGQCQHCNTPVNLNDCHIDHKTPLSKGGMNIDENLRTLCVICHTLRADRSHQGLVFKALRKGLIPPNWRELVWED
jgi:5-methylcytosine-specific restriction endonuclease McrA